VNLYSASSWTHL